MKNLKVIFVLFIFSLSSCTSLTQEETQTAVEKLVTRVQVLVDLLEERTNHLGLPPLDSAVIKLTQTEIKNKGVSASLVLSAGHSKSRTNSNSIKLVLKPSQIKYNQALIDRDEEILKSITAALNGIKSANGLILDSLELELAFSATSKLETGVEIEFIGFGVKGDKSSSIGNSLTLIFKEAAS